MKRSSTSVLGLVFSWLLLGAGAEAQKFATADHILCDDNAEQGDTERGCKETFTTIDFPGASYTDAQGINRRGHIVGEYMSGGETHGFLLRRMEFASIDFP